VVTLRAILRWQAALLLLGVVLTGAGRVWLQAEGNRALVRAAREGDSERVQHWLAAGAALNARVGDRNRTALIAAAAEGHAAVMRQLLDRGARLDQTDAEGATALLAATAWGRNDTIPLLLARGAAVNVRAVSCRGCWHSDDHPDLGYYPGWTPLHFAGWNGDGKTIRLLLQHGAIAQVTDFDGQTPLAVARQALRQRNTPQQREAVRLLERAQRQEHAPTTDDHEAVSASGRE
jgi:ankyrin repeat protein